MFDVKKMLKAKLMEFFIFLVEINISLICDIMKLRKNYIKRRYLCGYE